MPKKKNKKPLKVWVCRDESYHMRYCIYYKRPSMHGAGFLSNGKRCWNDAVYEICYRDFEKNFFKLKPGDGPVKCEIEIRRIK